MAFDGAFLYCVKKELDCAVGSHIDKIYVLSRDELVLVLRKKGFVKKLLLSCKSGMARIHFTNDLPENPETPPMFCQLARKYFSGAYFEKIALHGLERVIDLCFSATNEMGDRVGLKITAEFISGSSNIILINKDGRIFDAMKRTGLEAERLIAPGAVYCYPAPRGKLDIFENSPQEICSSVQNKVGFWSKGLLDTVEGLSPLICREIVYKALGGDAEIGSEVNIKPIIDALEFIKNEIISGGTPTMLYKKGEKPSEFTFTDICQYGDYYEKKQFPNYASLLDGFYSEKERIERLTRTGGDTAKTVKIFLARARKRMFVRGEELKSCENRENLRICGELLKANIHNIPAGAKEVRLQNFYDENLGLKTISLDPSLSAQSNAAKYFKEYKKTYGTEQSLKKLIEEDKREIDYLESVDESLSRAETLSDMAQIRQELSLCGYIKSPKNKTARKNQTPKFSEYRFGGYKIAVGKNNLQNDYLTCTVAKKGDLWFHAKNIHGAHTVIFTEGKEPPNEVLVFAAKLAAKNSKAAASSNVPVDYTDIKYVKKPSGAKAGMVIYTHNKTLFVSPEVEL